MQNSSAPLSFGDFLAVNYTSSPDSLDLIAWNAKQRKLNEDLSKKAHAASHEANTASDSAGGAAGADLSNHPAVQLHAKAYDLHRSAARMHAMDHRKTGSATSAKKAEEHRGHMRNHKDHLVALGALKESVEESMEQLLEIEESHILRFPHIKQEPVDPKKSVKVKVDKQPDNDPHKHCPFCAKLGKKHHIMNHIREGVAVETIEEQAAPKHPRHTVSISYDMPNHENRFERFTQRHVDVKVRAPNKDDAIAKAHKHVEKKGHRVLHSHHIGEEPLKEDFGGKFSDFHHWEKEAKARGLTVKRGTHPNGNVDSYSRAKDREGNDRGHFDHETRNGHLGEESMKESIGESAESADHGLKNHSSLKPGDKVETWNDYGPRHPLGSKYTAVVAKKDSKYAHLITVHPLHRKGTAGEGKPNTSDSRTVHVGQITHVNGKKLHGDHAEVNEEKDHRYVGVQHESFRLKTFAELQREKEAEEQKTRDFKAKKAAATREKNIQAGHVNSLKKDRSSGLKDNSSLKPGDRIHAEVNEENLSEAKNHAREAFNFSLSANHASVSAKNYPSNSSHKRARDLHLKTSRLYQKAGQKEDAEKHAKIADEHHKSMRVKRNLFKNL